MGDNAEHRYGLQPGSPGDDSAVADDPVTQTDLKAFRAKFNGRRPE